MTTLATGNYHIEAVSRDGSSSAVAVLEASPAPPAAPRAAQAAEAREEIQGVVQAMLAESDT